MAETLTDFIKRNSVTDSILEDDLYGRNIYLLGSSKFGAVNEPMMIESLEEFKYYFGNEGTLYDAYSSMYDISDGINIFINKVTGSHSYLKLNAADKDDNILFEAIHIKSKEANECYNDIVIDITEQSFKITFPTLLGGKTIIYDLTKYIYLGSLVKVINIDTQNNLNHIYISTDADYFLETKKLYLVNNKVSNLSNGNSGLSYTKNTLYDSLSESYSLLEGLEIDVIIPLDAFLDDTHVSENRFYNRTDYLTKTENEMYLTFYKNLLEFSVAQLKSGLITHGIIGFNLFDEDMFKTYREEYISYLKESLTYSIENTKLKNYAYLVSASCGDLIYKDKSLNSYLAYGAILSSTLITLTTTNVKAENASLKTYFKESELKDLADFGFIAFRRSPFKNGAVVFSGVTTRQIGELHYITNVRMVQLAIAFTKIQLGKLIGENLEVIYKNGFLEKLMKYLLDYLISLKLLTEYSLSVIYDSDYSESLKVFVDIKTIYMKEYIKTSNIFYISEAT